jgi:hypothetical protein
MKINVAPKGRNVGFKRRKSKEYTPDSMDEAAIKIAEITGLMEDSTESTINSIEMLRTQTLRKAEQ